jgi:hypothetical protein
MNKLLLILLLSMSFNCLGQTDDWRMTYSKGYHNIIMYEHFIKEHNFKGLQRFIDSLYSGKPEMEYYLIKSQIDLQNLPFIKDSLLIEKTLTSYTKLLSYCLYDKDTIVRCVDLYKAICVDNDSLNITISL